MTRRLKAVDVSLWVGTTDRNTKEVEAEITYDSCEDYLDIHQVRVWVDGFYYDASWMLRVFYNEIVELVVTANEEDDTPMS